MGIRIPSDAPARRVPMPPPEMPRLRTPTWRKVYLSILCHFNLRQTQGLYENVYSSREKRRIRGAPAQDALNEKKILRSGGSGWLSHCGQLYFRSVGPT